VSYQDFQGSTPDNPVDPYQTQYGSQEQYGVPPYAAGPSYGAYQGTPPPDYRAWANAAMVGGIFFSLIVGMPLAVIARFQGRRVRSLWAQGDTQGAFKASRAARAWVIGATVFDLLGVVLLIVLISRGGQSTS
jgi:hypothetical protein